LAFDVAGVQASESGESDAAGRDTVVNENDVGGTGTPLAFTGPSTEST
jgi:hypothetical protein